jgi:hypothetical protein
MAMLPGARGIAEGSGEELDVETGWVERSPINGPGADPVSGNQLGEGQFALFRNPRASIKFRDVADLNTIPGSVSVC